MIENPFHSLLKQEVALSREANDLQANLDALQKEYAQLQAQVPLMGKLLPVFNKQKTQLLSLQGRINEAQARVQAAMDTYEKHLSRVQAHARTWLEHKQDFNYTRSTEAFRFFADARKEIGRFCTRIERFLQAIGQARAAMSSGYDQVSKTYSPKTESLRRDLIPAAAAMDTAIDNIQQLSVAFKIQIKGTPFTLVSLPRFTKAQYSDQVHALLQLPIGEAQCRFEKLLSSCEQLQQEGIHEAYENLEAASTQLNDITDGYVSKAWRKEQAKLMVATPGK